MGGVADFIGDVVSDVVDAAGDAVEWVGDTVSNVVENALDDPVKTALQIAAIAAAPATGGASLTYGLPAIEAADVLEEGGSIEDVLKGAALTYATQQAVSFAVDSFGTPGVEMSGGETMQFFDDGTSIQFFDDGSTIFTDTAGAVSATPATDMISPIVSDATGFTPSGLEQPATPGSSEIAPIVEAGPAEITPIAGTEAVTPEVIADTTLPPPPQFETMEDLLSSIGELPPTELPGVFGGDVEAQPGGFYGQPEVQFPEAVAPVTDLSVPYEQQVDRPLTESLADLAMTGGETLYNYATENPLTTLGVGAALTGGLGGQPEMPQMPEEPAPRTYTYRPPITAGATQGLSEIYSAAQDIYGGRTVQPTVPGIPPPGSAAPTYTPPPLLAGPSGIASLRMPYIPMAGGQTFDISTLTPEQIIQLQNIATGRRVLGE